MNQNEIDELLSSHIMKWCVSYFELLACYCVFRAASESLDRKQITNAYNKEMNTMLRRASKFRDTLSDECYTCVCASIHQLKEDTQHTILNELEKGGLI